MFTIKQTPTIKPKQYFSDIAIFLIFLYEEAALKPVHLAIY